MNAAAKHTLHVLTDIVIGYGHSDEYSFVFHKSTSLFERRSAKIASTVVSTFTAAYVHLWPKFFLQGHGSPPENDTAGIHASMDVELDLSHLPTFDSRTVLYPSIQNLRDYLSWRQADCHINNLYNTTFWTLVQQGEMSNTEAEEFLKGTLSSDKNEILWSRFNLNYNNELAIFRKGSVAFRAYELEKPHDSEQSTDNMTKSLEGEDKNVLHEEEISKTQREKMKKARQKAEIVVEHIDIIKDDFWKIRPWLLSGKPGRPMMKDTISS